MKTRFFSSVFLLVLAAGAQAEESASVPGGFVKVVIEGSPNGSAHAMTQFFAPLHRTPLHSGRNAGSVSSVTANTFSDGSAGWFAGALAAAGSPFFVNITSGGAEGRMFQITGNTDTQITINTQSLSLAAVGLTPGDTYEILPGHTLLGIAGIPASGVIGGTLTQMNANQTDKIAINDSTGATRFYYYDTGVSQWRTAGSQTNQGNLVISPKAGLIYYRISPLPLEYVFYGRVPHANSQRQVPVTGTTIVAPYFPQDVTLASLGLHLLPGWRKMGDPGVALNTADRVSFKVPVGAVFSFYHDGASWRRAGSGLNQDTQILPAGASAILTRFGPIGPSENWLQNLPYNLE